MGDLRTLGALRTIDGDGMTIVPLCPDDRSRPDRRSAGMEDRPARDPGGRAAGRLVLLKPAAQPGEMPRSN